VEVKSVNIAFNTTQKDDSTFFISLTYQNNFNNSSLIVYFLDPTLFVELTDNNTIVDSHVELPYLMYITGKVRKSRNFARKSTTAYAASIAVGST
jgi:hypothetical protein